MKCILASVVGGVVGMIFLIAMSFVKADVVREYNSNAFIGPVALSDGSEVKHAGLHVYTHQTGRRVGTEATQGGNAAAIQPAYNRTQK